MNKLKYLIILALALLCASCSNIPFNERYVGANWNKVIIAPFTGDLTDTAELEFEHALAISMKMEIMPASITKMEIKKHGLETKFNEDPNKAMFKLATLLNADGIIFGDIELLKPKNGRSTSMATTTATFHAKLVDAKNSSIVASSLNESSSLFSDPAYLLQNMTQKSINEFQGFFDELNPPPPTTFSFSNCFSLC